METSLPFIPLPRALEIIATQLPLAKVDPPLLACTVSALVPVYAVGGGTPRALRESDLRGAVFANSGGAISFADGRRTIDNLAMTSDDITRVIRILQGATLQLEGANE